MNISVRDRPLISVRVGDTNHAQISINNETIIHDERHIDYIGEYDVKPSKNETILKTNGKAMTSDVVIEAIPFYKTKNAKGGNTVYIG